MSKHLVLSVCLAAGIAVSSAVAQKKPQKFSEGSTDTPFLPGGKWRVHDLERPHPAVVSPGARVGQPPSDAIVLFDGKDLSNWVTKARRSDEVTPPEWKVGEGYFEVVRGTGHLVSKQEFGDVQLHIEWASPGEVVANSQGRGNSGVLFMKRYEIQVLDSYDNVSYADGQAASIYGQYPPLVNASRQPGEWQSYDIIFEAPVFDGDRLVKPAYATVLHNGLVVHHRKAFLGPMRHKVLTQYEPHEAKGPLMLQSHGNPVRYRNVWVRRLNAYDQP